jgi:hypothetical protein
MKYGYARVSPGGKSESVDAQARQLTKAGCSKVFRDVHVSGAKTDRAQLRRVIEALEPADVLMVTRLDRLARSTRDLLNTLAAITAKKALAYVQLRRHHRAGRAASPKMASAGQHLVRRLHPPYRGPDSAHWRGSAQTVRDPLGPTYLWRSHPGSADITENRLVPADLRAASDHANPCRCPI